ncbi:hypothetical protein BH11PSE11_BH11PSE11_08440 [soil metagenome]
MDDGDLNATRKPTAIDDADAPKFGRLLIVLVLAVLLMLGITIASEAFYS